MSHGKSAHDLSGTRNFWCGTLVFLLVGGNVVFAIKPTDSVPPWFTVFWLVLVDLVVILAIILIIMYYTPRIAKLKAKKH